MRRLLPFLLALSCARPDASTVAPETVVEPIAWHDWGAEAFQRAGREDKIVLVDVGIEGCTACRWMYEITYTDPAVMRRMAESFVAVAVDADLRPDVGLRYYPWGWPATIFLLPDGTQVHAVRGNKLPKNFIPILDELLERKKNGELVAKAGEPTQAEQLPEVTELGQLCKTVVGQLDRSANREHGGWGFEGVRQVRGIAVEHAFMRGRARAEAWRTALALKTSQGMSQINDPVWGGAFVAAFDNGWTKPIPEKRTKTQTAVINSFVHAYGSTGDEAWLGHVDNARRYLEGWMRADDGTYFATQEDDAPKLPRGMAATEYYELSDTQRRKYGVPPIDHGIYTDINGRVVRAYAAIYSATGDEKALAAARTTADKILASRQTDQGWLRQSAESPKLAQDDRMRRFALDDRIYLRPQVFFGRALLALHGVTGEPRWLDAAKRIAAAMRSELEDKSGGGFYAAVADDTDALLGRIKSAEDNGIAAQFLLGLATLTQDERLQRSAERTLAYLGAPAVVRPAGAFTLSEIALAFELQTLGPVEFSVVGDRNDKGAQALFAAARSIYEPRKVLHFDETGRYPTKPHATLYICNKSTCSRPISKLADVARVARTFAEASATAPCAVLISGGS